MITISQPTVSRVDLASERLSAIICVDGQRFELWVEVESKYASYLCHERSDAFVAGLIFAAIKGHHDISFEAPLTDELKAAIEYEYIDVLCQHQKDLYKVKLFGPVAPRVEAKKGSRGTGISCGVDCLYTVFRRMKKTTSTCEHLLLADFHGDVVDDTEEERERRFDYLVKKATSFSHDFGLPLVVLRTNFNYCGIPNVHFEGETTFGNMFAVLALQKLFSIYYIASGGPIFDFSKFIHYGIYGTDCSNFDLLTLSAFSAGAVRFVVDGLESRTEKVRFLCSQPLAWRYLDVCHVHKNKEMNGTYDCPKCMYTINEIMAVGVNELDKFRSVFDVDYVKSHKYQYLAEIIRMKITRSETALELWPYKSQIGFSFFDWILACKIVMRKVIFKILRGGRTSNLFTPE